MRHPWVLGARPRTLPASVVPVMVGTGAAAAYGDVVWWRAVLAGLVALSLQVGVNYANDYSDGTRGTDADRVGPAAAGRLGHGQPRCRQAGGASGFRRGRWRRPGPGRRRRLVAGRRGGRLRGGGLVLYRRPRPYGYVGLGELAVFCFFGLVATVGTAYVQTGELTALEVLAALPVGLLAVALLVVNNLRDIPGDAAAGKHTLAVRLGPVATRHFYELFLAMAVVLVVPVAVSRPWAALGLGPSALFVPPWRAVAGGAEGRALIPVLGATGKAQLALGVLLAVGLAALGGRRRRPRNPTMTSATSAGRSRWQAWPAPATTCTEAEGPMAAAMRRAWST